MRIILNKPDITGAIVSSLCMIHCLATPIIFLAHSSSLHQSSSTPIWWKNLDFLFLGISFFAIHHAIKTTSSKVLKPALWITWLLLATLILNEKMHWLELAEYLIYIPALTLIVLHLYNLKYCQCYNDK